MTLDEYTRALALFGEQLRDVADHQWELATPCPDWDVRRLVAHVVLGEALVPPLLAGEAGLGASEADPGVLGTEPLAVWRGTALAAMEAVRALDSLDIVVEHPVGPVSAHVLLGFRVTENLVHGWDLATAVGRDMELPDDLVERCLDFWVPLAGSLGVDSSGSGGFFGPMVAPPPGSSASVRLLALLGRQVPAS